MYSIISSKKGQANSWFAVIVVLFISGFLLILSYLITLNMCDAFDNAGQTASSDACQLFLNGYKFMDYLMVLFMVILIIGIGITSYRLATSPVFAIITLIMAALYGFVSYYFNFIFVQMVSPNVFNSVVVFFPRTILINTNLHWIMLVNMIIGLITLYGKREKGQFLS